MEEMLEKMFLTTSTGNVPLIASSMSLAQNTYSSKSHLVTFLLGVHSTLFLIYFVMRDLMKDKKDKDITSHLIQQVESCNVGLLCMQELTGNFIQFLLICLLKTIRTD